ncbi:Uncharacterised protein [Amycolatopsis camponoti]|uniref:Secreted protein n=1 Tax=Amycolatopsis camponoti TaxID=2606593 RepID=A0A6I8LWB1_9PSEU|nr:hypothetical protein [Amycolatopsis camponoti]VVJ22404.1 Uncharacterised protein [Amycolatopsis camponoti]
MLLAVLLFLSGAPVVHPVSAVSDGPAVATTQSQSVLSGRNAAPRVPASIPFAVGPSSAGSPPPELSSLAEQPAESSSVGAPPLARSSRAPPSFVS